MVFPAAIVEPGQRAKSSPGSDVRRQLRNAPGVVFPLRSLVVPDQSLDVVRHPDAVAALADVSLVGLRRLGKPVAAYEPVGQQAAVVS